MGTSILVSPPEKPLPLAFLILLESSRCFISRMIFFFSLWAGVPFFSERAKANSRRKVSLRDGAIFFCFLYSFNICFCFLQSARPLIFHADFMPVFFRNLRTLRELTLHPLDCLSRRRRSSSLSRSFWIVGDHGTFPAFMLLQRFSPSLRISWAFLCNQLNLLACLGETSRFAKIS